MCNACGFHCCASDEFGGCGCDCYEPACWSEEEEDEDDGEGAREYGIPDEPGDWAWEPEDEGEDLDDLEPDEEELPTKSGGSGVSGG
jgi:hypothetical protein